MDFKKIYRVSYSLAIKSLKRAELAEEIAQDVALFYWEYEKKHGKESTQSIRFSTIDRIRERFGRIGTKRFIVGEDRKFAEFRETSDEQGPATILADAPTGHAVEFEELRRIFDEHSKHLDLKSSALLNIVTQWDLKDSGSLYGFSESRASQVRTRLIEKIKRDILLSQVNEFIEEGRTELSISWL